MEHHHSYNPEKEKKQKLTKLLSQLMLFLSLVILIPYLASQLLPFMRSASAHQKINVSSMNYIFLSWMLVLIPVLITLPSKWYKSVISKINLLGKVMAVTSFFYFCGMVTDIISYNILGGYKDTGADPILIKMLWGDVGVDGLIFCFIQGVFYLLLSKQISGHKKMVVLLFAGAYIAYIALPFMRMYILGTPFNTRDWKVWFFKNVYLWLSNLFLLAGLTIASTSGRVWSKIVWR